jgi:hypothetical protein
VLSPDASLGETMTFEVKADSEQFEDGRGVSFQASDGDKSIACIVSMEALRDAFGALRNGKTGYIAAYRNNSIRIHFAAGRNYSEGFRDADGVVVVSSFDFSHKDSARAPISTANVS